MKRLGQSQQQILVFVVRLAENIVLETETNNAYDTCWGGINS